ncbi:MAG: sporulation initiation factor Spo0A C-terminal domain-containing protein [Clostridia bacterium]|nr:sporulation initiation factor Spo0A C-terminal domain-containing protein [Clostridia bacterium]
MEDSTDFIKNILRNNIELFSQENDNEFRRLESMVTDIMIEIGVPAHVKGYCYMRTAIILTVQHPDLIYAMTKELYPSVGKIYLTTAQRVERAIRHAIELAWDNGDMEVLARYFSYRIRKSSDKPTNSEFIATISDKIRLER